MDDIKDDPRFAHILSDPKFRVMPKSKKKVKIDSRFRSVFSSEHFNHKTDIDKRGRPVFDVRKRNRHVMKRFYQLSEDENGDNSESGEEVSCKRHSQQQDNKHKRSKVTDDQNSQWYNEETETQPSTHIPLPDAQNKKPAETNSSRQKVKPLASRRDVTLSKKSSSQEDATSLPRVEDEDSSEDTTDDDDEDAELPEFSQEYAPEETEIDHKWNELHTDAAAVVESTHRLAVCNMDWDCIKAIDLFVLLKSFVPDGGRLQSVTIYPSEFGKERIAEEARFGPREMREHKSQECLKAADQEGQSGKKNRATHQQQVKRATKDLEASQMEKLREYQLNRLRYYFAVVDCDSVVTAETIYNECDGREYLQSSVRLDLRFIPDSITFDDPPREIFSQDQSILEYEPNRFSSTALCQAKVDVTRGETERDHLFQRIGAMQRKEWQNIEKMDKCARPLLPESDSDQDVDDQPDCLKHAATSENRELTEEEKIALYRQLLIDKLDDEEDDDDGDEGKEGEKEVVWKPGLKSSLVKRMEKIERQRQNTGVVNDYLDKKKEKKKRKKKKRKEDRVEKSTANEKEQTDIVNNNVNENIEAVSNMQTTKKKKKQKMCGVEDNADAKNTADLMLLVMGDHGVDVKDAHDKHTLSNKKGKKLKMKKKQLAKVRDECQLDMNDPRFAAVYTSQHFHIDPSSSQFKKSTNMTALMNEQIKRRGHPGKPETETESKPGHGDEHSRSLSRALVESIKLKMKR